MIFPCRTPFSAITDSAKSQHRLRGPAQNHGFQAVVVIEMRMHRRHRDVVMIVMHGCEAARELPLVMVEHVAQRADALPRACPLAPLAADLTAQQIADRFERLV